MSLLDTFKSEVEAYLSDFAVKPTTFGQLALGDPNFVFDLRNGRAPNAVTIDRVRAFMRVGRSELSKASTDGGGAVAGEEPCVSTGDGGG